MKDRLRQARKTLKLTQVEFGRRIGIKGNTITNYENGLRSPSDAVIFSICREFKISEEWLRTGRGEMFQKLPAYDELSDYVEELLMGENDIIYQSIRSFMVTYGRLDKDSKAILQKIGLDWLENMKKERIQ